MAREDDRHVYLLGHDQCELERLERQGRLFAEATDDGLRRAGLRPGMRVLDLGCGVGDVTLAAAGIVGPSGSVVGVDRSPDAVATANRRAKALGVASARCVEAELSAVDPLGFDAIVGRFILMHLPHPAALLARLRRDASPGTLLAFLEMDLSSASITPELPLFDAGMLAIISVYRAGGVEPDMGSRLYTTFRAADLQPALKGSCHVAGSGDPEAFNFLARTVSSLAPAMRAAGVMWEGLEPDTYRDRLLAEAAKADHCVSYPRFVCAWAET
jgi:SAM-dependent methyltransferase